MMVVILFMVPFSFLMMVFSGFMMVLAFVMMVFPVVTFHQADTASIVSDDNAVAPGRAGIPAR